MEKLFAPAQKELQQKKFEMDGELFQEFNGDFEAYWAWYTNQHNAKELRRMDGR